jgi:hypothetical protein
MWEGGDLSVCRHGLPKRLEVFKDRHKSGIGRLPHCYTGHNRTVNLGTHTRPGNCKFSLPRQAKGKGCEIRRERDPLVPNVATGRTITLCAGLTLHFFLDLCSLATLPAPWQGPSVCRIIPVVYPFRLTWTKSNRVVCVESTATSGSFMYYNRASCTA